MEGEWFNYEPGDDSKRKLVIHSLATDKREAEVIRRGDIPGFLTEENTGILRAYNLTKKYGLPYKGGWADQPGIVLDIIWALDCELALIQKAARGNNGNG